MTDLIKQTLIDTSNAELLKHGNAPLGSYSDQLKAVLAMNYDTDELLIKIAELSSKCAVEAVEELYADESYSSSHIIDENDTIEALTNTFKG